jgi:hypothetical protein
MKRVVTKCVSVYINWLKRHSAGCHTILLSTSITSIMCVRVWNSVNHSTERTEAEGLVPILWQKINGSKYVSGSDRHSYHKLIGPEV